MKPYLNFHTHRAAVSPTETVIRNLPCTVDDCINQTNPENGWFSTGIHPWHIPDTYEDVLKRLSEIVRHPHCMTLGEAGLDRCTETSFSLQREIFVRQLAIATECNVPVTIHCVRAWGELMEIIKQENPDVACIVHGFRGKPALARQLLDKGLYLSFGFRFNKESMTYCPSDRIFLETDENPRSVENLYHIAASLRGCTAEELNALCRQNLRLVSSKNF